MTITPAPNSSRYLLVTPDVTNLPNSQILTSNRGIVLQDSGPQNPLNISTNGNLLALNNINAPGYIKYNVNDQLVSSSINAGNGIQILEEPDSLEISLVPNSSVQRINVNVNGASTSFSSPLINFISGSGISIFGQYNVSTGANDITIYSNGGGGGGSGTVTLVNLASPDGTVNITGTNPITTSGTINIQVPNWSTKTATTTVNLGTYSIINVSAIQAPTNSYLTLQSGTAQPIYLNAPSSYVTIAADTFYSAPTAIVLGTNVTSQVLTPQITYVSTNATSRVTFTIPTSVGGQTFSIAGYGDAGWIINLSGGQQVIFGNQTATSLLASTLKSDSITLICISNNIYSVFNSFGNITVT